MQDFDIIGLTEIGVKSMDELREKQGTKWHGRRLNVICNIMHMTLRAIIQKNARSASGDRGSGPSYSHRTACRDAAGDSWGMR